MGLNDAAWEKLFEKYHILDAIARHGSLQISASQIKEFREPRLMTKFDHKVNLPQLFALHHLAILPITRGDYIISRFSAYQDFEPPSGVVQSVRVPAYVQSLMPSFLVSEAIALNCANACGILSDFLEDEALVPTVSGRMSSGVFEFSIHTDTGRQTLTVSNSQIEIDAAYEGVNALSVFEAKRDLSDDFLIRQLYYPFRTWNNRITKQVKPVFLVFSNGTFYLYQYEFTDVYDYNSLRLVKQKNYIISQDISLEDLQNVWRSTPVCAEPEIAFPQANSMPRLVNLMELLADGPMTRQDITTRYAFDERQTNYYTDAGRYLSLIEKSRDEEGAILFQLSASGKRVMELPYKERQIAIASAILQHRVFHKVFEICLRCGEMPDGNAIVRMMRESGLFRVAADSTYYRRSSTIVGWLNWILGLVQER